MLALKETPIKKKIAYGAIISIMLLASAGMIFYYYLTTKAPASSRKAASSVVASIQTKLGGNKAATTTALVTSVASSTAKQADLFDTRIFNEPVFESLRNNMSYTSPSSSIGNKNILK